MPGRVRRRIRGKSGGRWRTGAAFSSGSDRLFRRKFGGMRQAMRSTAEERQGRPGEALAASAPFAAGTAAGPAPGPGPQSANESDEVRDTWSDAWSDTPPDIGIETSDDDRAQLAPWLLAAASALVLAAIASGIFLLGKPSPAPLAGLAIALSCRRRRHGHPAPRRSRQPQSGRCGRAERAATPDRSARRSRLGTARIR